MALSSGIALGASQRNLLRRRRAAGYRGEIMVMLSLDMNAPLRKQNNTVVGYKIHVADKIAQLVTESPNVLFHVAETDIMLRAVPKGAEGIR